MKKLKAHKEGRPWSGYDMDRLVYERAVTLAHIQLEKERIAMEANRVQRGNFFFSRSMFSRLLSMVGYADFLVIGVRLWQKLSPLFHKKH